MTSETDLVLLVDVLSHGLQLLVAGQGPAGARALVQADGRREEAVDQHVGIATDRRGEMCVSVQSQT